MIDPLQNHRRESAPLVAPLAGWRNLADRALGLVQSRECRLLLEHWRDLGTAAQPPGRRELDATAFGPALPYVWLLDYLPETRRLRYRLVGEDVAARYSYSLLGKHLDEVVDGSAMGQVLEYFLACPEAPAITLLLGRLYQEWRKPGEGERLLLPLLAPDGEPEGVIGLTLCRRFYLSQQEAGRNARRRQVVLPLDGGPPSDVTA